MNNKVIEFHLECIGRCMIDGDYSGAMDHIKMINCVEYHIMGKMEFTREHYYDQCKSNDLAIASDNDLLTINSPLYA